MLRSLNTQRTMADPYNGVYRNIIDLWLSGQGEMAHAAPSVFSFYSPDNTVNGGTLYAPELQLENQASIAEMMRHAQDLLDNNYNLPASLHELTMDLSATSPLGIIASQQGPDGLVRAIDALLLHGTMSKTMRDVIVASVSHLRPQLMVENAVYLVITSSQYRTLI